MQCGTLLPTAWCRQNTGRGEREPPRGPRGCICTCCTQPPAVAATKASTQWRGVAADADPAAGPMPDTASKGAGGGLAGTPLQVWVASAPPLTILSSNTCTCPTLRHIPHTASTPPPEAGLGPHRRLWESQIVKQQRAGADDGSTRCSMRVEAKSTRRLSLGSMSSGDSGKGYRRSWPPCSGRHLAAARVQPGAGEGRVRRFTNKQPRRALLVLLSACALPT